MDHEGSCRDFLIAAKVASLFYTPAHPVGSGAGEDTECMQRPGTGPQGLKYITSYILHELFHREWDKLI